MILCAVGKLKHPNQYTYRGGPPIGTFTNVASTNKPSPAKNGKSGEHGARKSAPQSSRAVATQNQSPSPIPLSYNVPDHFSHLVPLLPHPTPQGISVPIRVELVPTTTGIIDGDGSAEVDGSVHTRIVLQTEKGVKVRWPPKRTTIGEMRRRVRAMMEYVARAQLDAGERERRAEMLRAAAVEAQAEASALLGAEHESIVPSSGAKGERERNGNSHSTATLAPTEFDVQQAAPTMAETATPLPNGDIDTEMADGDTGASSSDPSRKQPKTEEVLEAALPPDDHGQADNTPPTATTSTPPTGPRTPAILSSCNLSAPVTPVGPTTTQLLDELTRELIRFQERFGAGREGKVYPSNRAETRERRTRNAAPLGGPDPDMF